MVPGTVPVMRPRRSTLTRSQMARTSPSLWLMKTTDETLGDEAPEGREEDLDLLGHEHGGGLVHDQDAAIPGERLEDLDPLLLPDGQVTDDGVAARR